MKPGGYTFVALVLASGVAIAIVVLAVGSVAINGPVSTEEATLLSTALGAAIGAVATYLGTRGAAPPEPASSPPPDVPPAEGPPGTYPPGA